MCSTYRIQSKRGAEGLAQRVSEAFARLKSELARKDEKAGIANLQ